MNCSDNHCSSCIFDILKKILMLQQQEYDESTIIGKSVLGSVNVSADTQQKELNNATTIAATNLSGINANSTANKNDVTNDFMAQTQGMTAATFAGMAAQEQTKKQNDKVEEAIKEVDEKYKDSEGTE